jgi:hypothetical protein
MRQQANVQRAPGQDATWTGARGRCSRHFAHRRRRTRNPLPGRLYKTVRRMPSSGEWTSCGISHASGERRKFNDLDLAGRRAGAHTPTPDSAVGRDPAAVSIYAFPRGPQRVESCHGAGTGFSEPEQIRAKAVDPSQHDLFGRSDRRINRGHSLPEGTGRHAAVLLKEAGRGPSRRRRRTSAGRRTVLHAT